MYFSPIFSHWEKLNTKWSRKPYKLYHVRKYDTHKSKCIMLVSI